MALTPFSVLEYLEHRERGVVGLEGGLGVGWRASYIHESETSSHSFLKQHRQDDCNHMCFLDLGGRGRASEYNVCAKRGSFAPRTCKGGMANHTSDVKKMDSSQKKAL